MLSNRLYYHLRPLIPRRLQIAARRAIVQRKRALCADVWPIDPEAGTPPSGWQGWPEGKKFALVLTHDVETARGQENVRALIELEERLGFRSSFGFVPERYRVSPELRKDLEDKGFEVVVHGLYHDGKYYQSRKTFRKRANRINQYLVDWNAAGFRSPSMQHNLEWIHDLKIAYDMSTFDTDPFEPQPMGVRTIFPFFLSSGDNGAGYVEMPYTLPQDFTLFVMMAEKGIDIWKQKLDWIAEHGGMALLITHPDYMEFSGRGKDIERYPARYYSDFLEYVKEHYNGLYWNALPQDIARHVHALPNRPVDRSSSRPGLPASVLPTPSHARRRVWIDLDNSPHVPFFKPIIEELGKRGCEVFVTARDCSQTCELADLHSLDYSRIGRHYGKSRVLKVAGTVARGLQLARAVKSGGLDLALSHGSRAQMLAACMLRIPSVVIMDYEHVKGFIHPTWLMMPEVISTSSFGVDRQHIVKYPGIKEDVYVPTFKPDSEIRCTLGLSEEDTVVTVRPPATEAHYHNPEGEALFLAAVNMLGEMDGVRMVILPRNNAQKVMITNIWSQWCEAGKIIIPDKVLDGLNLLWHSDLVISGGGTMNREAAALGVPVYSIFRGPIGAVDQYLADNGRLILLESVEDVWSKLRVVKRNQTKGVRGLSASTLESVVDGIMLALKSRL